MPVLVYLLFAFLLILITLLYFKVATYYNIIDHPNERSSHSEITLLGGGLIFPLAILLYSTFFGFPYLYFLAGLLLISFISFWDDLQTLSPTLRLPIHLIAVGLMFVELGIFNLSIWVIIMIFIIVIGTINAYNFMDGINGITGLYSLSVIVSLIYLNNKIPFIEQEFLLIASISILVFLFFNFRIKAKCFAGDVGSIAIAFIILFSLGLLILSTGQFLYILFLAVYGTDVVLTIIFRLLKKQNIFDPHRSHVYQILSNEKRLSHLFVSSIYSAFQIVINVLVISMVSNSMLSQIIFAFFILFSLSILYLHIKPYVKSSYSTK